MNKLNNFAVGVKKTVRVLNLKPYPVVVNSEGQAVPGGEEAIVSKGDAVLKTCIDAEFVIVVG